MIPRKKQILACSGVGCGKGHFSGDGSGKGKDVVLSDGQGRGSIYVGENFDKRKKRDLRVEVCWGLEGGCIEEQNANKCSIVEVYVFSTSSTVKAL